MRGQVLMPLLVARVFGHEMEVFATDDEGTVHFGRDDGAGENAAPDRDLPGEGTFLICFSRC